MPDIGRRPARNDRRRADQRAQSALSAIQRARARFLRRRRGPRRAPRETVSQRARIPGAIDSDHSSWSPLALVERLLRDRASRSLSMMTFAAGTPRRARLTAGLNQRGVVGLARPHRTRRYDEAPRRRSDAGASAVHTPVQRDAPDASPRPWRRSAPRSTSPRLSCEFDLRRAPRRRAGAEHRRRDRRCRPGIRLVTDAIEAAGYGRRRIIGSGTPP